MRNSGFVFPAAAFGALMLVASMAGAAHAQSAAAETLWPTRQWQTSTPEEQGMDSAALVKLLAFGKARSFDSLLVVRHGRIVLDAYYAPYTADIPHAINSSTKAVDRHPDRDRAQGWSAGQLDHRVLDFFAGRTSQISTTGRKRSRSRTCWT